MDYLTSEQIKNELTLMMSKLDVYLKENNLQYSIEAGTMLGAVRHGGFIPWDDDIDIAMLRPEYDKLVSKLKQDNYSLGNGLTAVGFELGNDDWPFIKILNPSFAAKEDISSKEYNLWIDIFPFDGLPRKKERYLYFKDKFLFVLMNYKRLSIYGGVNIESKSTKSLIVHSIIKVISKVLTMNTINNLLISYCKKYGTDNCEYVEDMTWGFDYVPRAIFDEMTDYKFENIVVKGFKDYDTYLSCVYGDYMKLPPIEKRINHNVKVWKISND